MFASFFQNRAAGYVSSVLGIAAVTVIYAPFRGRLHDATVALTLVLVVLFIATLWGRGPGMVASILGMFSYNFFLLPPTYSIYSFTIADPQNWIALAAFMITASTVGHLSVTAKRREADIRLLARLRAVVAELEERAFAGKAAPGYWMAKQMIKLIHNVGRVINNDLRASESIKVAFIPDYRVSLAEKIIPAADLSEQISTAGKEASGTSNMKFALNGALTIGTLDGANIEILKEAGAENIFIFGLKIDEVQSMRAHRSYRPWDYCNRNPRVKRVVDAFRSHLFCPHEPDLFGWIYQHVLDENDEYFHLADLDAYLESQEMAGETFNDPLSWTRMAILNVARIGKFSSDRTVTEYARDIWDIKSI